MQNMLGFTGRESGLVLLTGAVVMGLFNPVTGRLFDLYGARYLAIGWFAILSITTYMCTNLTTESTSMYMSILNAVRMLCSSMVMMTVTTSCVNKLPDGLIPHGSAMNNTVRQMAGAIGTGMLVTIMSTAAHPSEGTQGLIDGVNMSFYVATVLSALG